MSKEKSAIDAINTELDRRFDNSSQLGSPPKAKTSKRKRNTSKPRTAASQEIGPPPFLPTGPGDTVVAQNPFDDYPPQLRFLPNKMRPGMPMPSMPMAPGPGKMYPPNQSTIFNSTNPNAPPIYPCGICHKEVHDNDQAILCESGCNFWYHRICTGLTDAAYHMLTQEVYAEWVCDKCVATKNIPLVKMKP